MPRRARPRHPRSRIANHTSPTSNSADAETSTGRSARAIRATRVNTSAITESAATSASAAPAARESAHRTFSWSDGSATRCPVRKSGVGGEALLRRLVRLYSSQHNLRDWLDRMAGQPAGRTGISTDRVQRGPGVNMANANAGKTGDAHSRASLEGPISPFVRQREIGYTVQTNPRRNVLGHE